jgi:hypothetical protein
MEPRGHRYRARIPRHGTRDQWLRLARVAPPGVDPGRAADGCAAPLKTNVNGADPALRKADPNVRKIFRAMQKYELIVADNGSGTNEMTRAKMRAVARDNSGS